MRAGIVACTATCLLTRYNDYHYNMIYIYIRLRLRLEFPRAKLSFCKLRIFGVQGGAVLPRATLSRLKYVSGGLVTV